MIMAKLKDQRDVFKEIIKDYPETKKTIQLESDDYSRQKMFN